MTTPIPKTLVIGSTGHQYVQSVRWEDAAAVNIVDFASVVVNVRSLTTDIVKTIPSTHFKKIRTKLSRLLRSGASIIVLGAKVVIFDLGKLGVLGNYSWSPLVPEILNESGDTIEVINDMGFPRLLTHLKKWRFYYAASDSMITHELREVCGATYQYRPEPNIFLMNRYHEMLAGAYDVQVFDAGSGNKIGELGRFTLLPCIEELDEREAVNLVLEDLLQLPQETLPPEWAVSVGMPLIDKIQADIDQRTASITELQEQIRSLEKQKRCLEEYKKLLYGSGVELEQIFVRCLEALGGKVTPAKYSEEEFVLDWKGSTYLVECKGVGKSIALTHVRQLLSYVLKYQEDEGKKGKGILLGNAWKDSPLPERGTGGRVIFPANAIEAATDHKIALLSSVDFFHAFCRFLAEELAADAVMDWITNGPGVVDPKTLGVQPAAK